MIILPAIDIRMGKVVRLLQGDFTKETVYSGDPINMALRWEKEGAAMLHVVDLDGALLGKLMNLAVIKEMASAIKIPIELGGGLRNDQEIQRALSGGVGRVILGTKAYGDENFLKRIIREYRNKIAVSIDAVKGVVISEGWKTQTNINALEFIRKIHDIGVETIIYTDILKDGMMQGPNLDSIGEVLDAVKCDIIVSGGISCLEDIKALKDLNKDNLAGVIVGKALYEGAFTLKEANAITEATK